MRLFLVTLGRAVMSQLHARMLLLTVLPFLASIAIWAVLLWLFLQPTIDWLHAYFTEHEGFAIAGEMLGWLGLSGLNTVLVPLIAMWVLLPLMILTSLVFVGSLAMPAVARHVGSRWHPRLERLHGGSLWGSLWTAAWSFAVFVVAWLVTLPLTLFPPLAFVVHPLLWGWLTYQVMAYDALAEHASAHERREIMRQHRWSLLLIGAVAGILGTAPTLLWLGGPLSVIFFPLLAAGAIWLYVLLFVFSGLWFEHYCLEALARYRGQALVMRSPAAP